MKKYKIIFFRLVLIIVVLSCTGCGKTWLAEKRNLNTVLPVTLADFRAILNVVNSPSMSTNYAGMMQVSADDLYVTDASFNSGTERDQNLYTWNKLVYTDLQQVVPDWNNSYNQVLATNVVLEGLSKVDKTNSNTIEWNDIKGGALFFRAKSYYNLIQSFASPFDSKTAKNDLGIPLRLSSDPNPVSKRANVQEVYDLIVGDLKVAASLLRVQPVWKTDASRTAAYAQLARVYLSMGKYSEALLYADSALQINSKIIDYNDVVSGADNTYPFQAMNEETILYSELSPAYRYDIITFSLVNPVLFDSYDLSDTRRTLFFRSTGAFRGNYTGSSTRFSGLTTAEMYLILAECKARGGDEIGALEALNYLSIRRYLSTSFIPFTVNNTDNVLKMILQQRRKELLYRCLRWSDLRRLNKEPEHAVILTRIVDGITYKLPPNDPRYTLPIPEYIIELTGMDQNIR